MIFLHFKNETEFYKKEPCNKVCHQRKQLLSALLQGSLSKG